MHTREQLQKGIEMAKSRGMSIGDIEDWMRARPAGHYMYQFTTDDFDYLKGLSFPGDIEIKTSGQKAYQQLDLF